LGAIFSAVSAMHRHILMKLLQLLITTSTWCWGHFQVYTFKGQGRR